MQFFTAIRFVFFFFLLLNGLIVNGQWWAQPLANLPQKSDYKPGSFRFEKYVENLKGKRVALVINHTASFRSVSLVDTLQSQGIQIAKIFAPEHGFRGKAEAGQIISSGVDEKTGLKIISLYGKNKKPSKESLKDVDIVLFDIQDVGARFYTYISTLKMVMEACAENHKKLVVLDRANPLGFCVDGPILKPGYESFVGVFPIPVVHGLTVGELAKMAKVKKWFRKSKRLKLSVVECEGYSHSDTIFPELPPSPNLTTPLSILAYPSLCLFEGTKISVGRGTDFPFQIFGMPDSLFGPFQFKPEHRIKSGPAPMYSGQNCYGFQLGFDSISSCFDIRFLKYALARSGLDSLFFNTFFDKLAGSKMLRNALLTGSKPEFDNQIFIEERKRFLLYP
jgi:uncharacterized protein YbbC (DUF1343 family)